LEGGEIPYARGIHIRDLKQNNLALGAKVLGKIILGKNEWVKQVLHKNYLKISWLRILDTESVH